MAIKYMRELCSKYFTGSAFSGECSVQKACCVLGVKMQICWSLLSGVKAMLIAIKIQMSGIHIYKVVM